MNLFKQKCEYYRYAWLEHDGRTFGLQEIIDRGIKINTSFVKVPGGEFGGDWTANIEVTTDKTNNKDTNNKKNDEISLLFYTALDEKTSGRIEAVMGEDSRLIGMKGRTQGLSGFSIELLPTRGVVEESSFLITTSPGLQALKETVMQNLRLASQEGTNKKRIVLSGEQLIVQEDGKKLPANFIVTQVTARAPFAIQMIYESSSFVERETRLAEAAYDAALAKRRRQFGEKFEKTFKLKEKSYNEEEIKFGKMALSNMIGSIGYFYGAAQVQSEYTKGPVPYWKSALYTAVPSRSFFPRGFLWDEGFHGLLIASWDLGLEFDIISHWFDLMNTEGWIPREMILGEEALAKVPTEFVTQKNTNANPPTFLLTLQSILRRNRNKLTNEQLNLLENLYPRLQVWFDWYNTTQIGQLPGEYNYFFNLELKLTWL